MSERHWLGSESEPLPDSHPEVVDLAEWIHQTLAADRPGEVVEEWATRHTDFYLTEDHLGQAGAVQPVTRVMVTGKRKLARLPEGETTK